MHIYFFHAALIVSAYFVIGFIIAQIKQDNSFVDVMWGAGFIVLTAGLYLIRQLGGETMINAHFIILIMTSIWGFRLTRFLFRRNRKVGEDFRYIEMRKKWGDRQKLNAFFKVFMLQGVLQYIVAFAIVVVFAYPREDPGSLANFALVLGATVWVFGFIFELVADRQMRNFKDCPETEGRVLNTGLWRYSRHPNYFGEATLWWGLWIVVLGNAQFPYNLIAIISPITITVLVRFISGVPLLEERMMQRQEYREYASHTSTFFPLPPKPGGRPDP